MKIECFVKSVTIVCLIGLLVFGRMLLTDAQQDAGYYLNHVNPDYVVTPQEAYEWHAAKDAMGPTYSGSASWKNFLAIVEAKLKEYGAVDIVRNAWTYDRWHTSDWPDDTSWGLVSGGDPVKDGLVASMRRSGGNVTAVTRLARDVVPKRLALLHELAPAAGEIGMLFNLAASDPDPPLSEIAAAARALGLALTPMPAGTDQSLAIAMEAFSNKMKGAALLISNDAFFLGRRNIFG